jgi:glutamine amidotransferase
VNRPIAVVDYGVNNVGSVLNMLRHLGVEAVAAHDAGDLVEAPSIILPGIGSFDTGVTNLRNAGLFDALKARVQEHGVPILGICLGMQLLTKGSEEGRLEGLGLVDAFTRRFVLEGAARSLKVPHMGWNDTDCIDAELFDGLQGDARFYYVHSYHVHCADPADVAARCTHGAPFTAALRRGRVFGTQFHPEKSHRFGKLLLQNFLRLTHHG